MIRQLILATLLALTMTPGVRYYDWRWKQIARTRRALDGRRCTRCHSSSLLQVHHRRPIARGGNHFLWNLVSVCNGCHERLHGWDIDGDGRVGK